MLIRKAIICAALVGASLPAARSQTSGKSGTVPTPDKMRFCAYFCFVLTRQGDHYNAVDDGSVNGPVKSTYRITAFTQGSVVINRTDTGGGGGILRGHLSADGESVADGTAEYRGKDGSVSRFPFQLAWGNSIQKPEAMKPGGTSPAIASSEPATASVPHVSLVSRLRRISGNVTPATYYDLQDIPAPKLPVAYAPMLPSSMRFCAAYCFKLTRNGDHYDAVREGDKSGTVFSTYHVRQFSRFSVLIHRIDTDGGTVDLIGGIGSDNAGVIGGKLLSNGANGQTVKGTYKLTWDPTDGLAAKDKSQLTRQDIDVLAKQAELFYHVEMYDAAFPLYEIAASAGNTRAQTRMGIYYFNGIHEAKDCAEALRRYHFGDDHGDPAGTFELARMYDNGWCMQEDDAQANRLYEKAAKMGDFDAAIMTVDNRMMTNPADAATLMASGAEAGDTRCMMILANLYLAGTQIKRNVSEARSLFEAASARGNPQAIASLATYYRYGYGGQVDIGEAYRWYDRAAMFGNKDSEIGKRSLVDTGFDPAKETSSWNQPGELPFSLEGMWQAFFEMRYQATTIRIAQAGNRLVAYKINIEVPSTNLGYFMRVDYDPSTFSGKARRAQDTGYGRIKPLSEESWGGPEDFIVLDPDHFELEGKVFQRASALNAYDVACDEHNSYGVEAPWATERAEIADKRSDFTTAACWYHTAALGGSARSMSEYGNRLHEGLGVQKNIAEAVQWLEKGSASGDYYGAQILASMYEKGDGVAADGAKAQEWSAKSKELKAALDRVLDAQRKQEQAYQRDLQFFHTFMTGATNIFLNEMAKDPACDEVLIVTLTERDYVDSMRRKKAHDDAEAKGLCEPKNIDITQMYDVSGVKK